MAHKLNIRTICEGIESPEEYQWAVRHGADYVQGFLFGRPSPVPEIGDDERDVAHAVLLRQRVFGTLMRAAWEPTRPAADG